MLLKEGCGASVIPLEVDACKTWIDAQINTY